MTAKVRTAVVVISAFAALSSACSSGGPSAAKSPPSSTASLADAHAVLARVALRAGDGTTGTTVSLLPGGDQVVGRVTLDLCGAAFPSEQARTGRLQQVVRDATGNEIVSDEHVRYQTARDGVDALKEVRAAIAQCRPDEFRKPHVRGLPLLRYKIDVIPNSRLGTLTKDRVAVATTMTAQDGRTAFDVAIYQRRGAVLSAVYGSSVDQILPFAHFIAGRLAALTPEAVGE